MVIPFQFLLALALALLESKSRIPISFRSCQTKWVFCIIEEQRFNKSDLYPIGTLPTALYVNNLL